MLQSSRYAEKRGGFFTSMRIVPFLKISYFLFISSRDHPATDNTNKKGSNHADRFAKTLTGQPSGDCAPTPRHRSSTPHLARRSCLQTTAPCPSAIQRPPASSRECAWTSRSSHPATRP